MNRIVYKSEKDYSATVRALMREGCQFETDTDENGNLIILAEPSALATVPKSKPETKPATVEPSPLTKTENPFSWVADFFKIGFSILGTCIKWGFILVLLLAFPLVAFFPAFWSGVLSGSRSSGGGDGGGGTGGA